MEIPIHKIFSIPDIFVTIIEEDEDKDENYNICENSKTDINNIETLYKTYKLLQNINPLYLSGIILKYSVDLNTTNLINCEILYNVYIQLIKKTIKNYEIIRHEGVNTYYNIKNTLLTLYNTNNTNNSINNITGNTTNLLTLENINDIENNISICGDIIGLINKNTNTNLHNNKILNYIYAIVTDIKQFSQFVLLTSSLNF
jgi:hypothetical protein